MIYSDCDLYFFTWCLNAKYYPSAFTYHGVVNTVSVTPIIFVTASSRVISRQSSGQWAQQGMQAIWNQSTYIFIYGNVWLPVIDPPSIGHPVPCGRPINGNRAGIYCCHHLSLTHPERIVNTFSIYKHICEIQKARIKHVTLETFASRTWEL